MRVTPELVTSLGTDDFFKYFSRALGKLLPIDHVALFAFDNAFVPHFIIGDSRGEGAITSRISKLYEKKSYYHHDPSLKWVERNTKDDSSIPLLHQMHAEDIKDEAYRRNIYEDNALLDRLSLIDHDKQNWFILNFYRDVGNGFFSEQEVGLINKESCLIAAFVKRHLSLLPPIGWDDKTILPIEKLEELMAGLGGDLSKREMEVCARAMQGLTREAIALDLGVKPPTVATFMKRAYGKLSISSLNELFALCLGELSKKN